MKRQTLRTVDELIDAFGGEAIVAEWLNVGRSAVSNWKHRGIPSIYHLIIWREAEEWGLRIDPKLLGVDKWPSLRDICRQQTSVA